MAKIETNTRKIVARLQSEGWVNVGGGSHDRFVVPRHRELTPGTAHSIAKAAGWI